MPLCQVYDGQRTKGRDETEDPSRDALCDRVFGFFKADGKKALILKPNARRLYEMVLAARNGLLEPDAFDAEWPVSASHCNYQPQTVAAVRAAVSAAVSAAASAAASAAVRVAVRAAVSAAICATAS